MADCGQVAEAGGAPESSGNARPPTTVTFHPFTTASRGDALFRGQHRGDLDDAAEAAGDAVALGRADPRHLDVDPEKALSGANVKFERRFRDMEAAVAEKGSTIKEFSLETLDQEWRAAKKRVG